MKLHLPHFLRRALVSASMAYCCFSTSSADTFESNAVLSGDYENGIGARSDADLTNYGTVHTSSLSLREQSSLSNHGSIFVEGNIKVTDSASFNNKGYIQTQGVLQIAREGVVTNNGTIFTSKGVSFYDGYQYGGKLINHGKLVSQGDIGHYDCSLENTGELECTRIYTSYFDNSGTTFCEKVVVSNITNSGELEINHTKTSASGYYGRLCCNKLTNTNEGTIRLHITNPHEGGSAYAYHGWSGNVANEGRILAIAEADGNAVGYSPSGNFSYFENSASGNIQIQAVSNSADAKGIRLSSNVNASLNNSGILSLDVTGATTAYGMEVKENVRNYAEGTLSVRASGQKAYGIFCEDTRYLYGSEVLENSGYMSVHTRGQKAYGVYLHNFKQMENTLGGNVEIYTICESESGYGLYSSTNIINGGTFSIYASSYDEHASEQPYQSDANLYAAYISSGKLENNGDFFLQANATEGKACGLLLTGSTLTNNHLMEINAQGDTAYGIQMTKGGWMYNNGTLLTDNIRMSGSSSSSAYLLDSSTTGAFTQGKALEISGEYANYSFIYLGGALNESGSVGVTEGGSKVHISSALTLSSASLRLKDNVTLNMQGDLTLASDLKHTWNNYTLTINNVGSSAGSRSSAVHTVTVDGYFVASWDGAAGLTSDMGMTWDNMESGTQVPSQLTLHSGTLKVHGGQETSSFSPDKVVLKSGTLDMCADTNGNMTVENTTITWDAEGDATPQLKVTMDSSTQSGGMEWDTNTMKFAFNNVSVGSKLLDLDCVRSEAKDFLFKAGEFVISLYAEITGKKSSLYCFNYNGLAQLLDKAPTGSCNQEEVFANRSYRSAVIYESDVYSTQQTTTPHKLIGNKTYRGDKFVTYDTEKYTLSSGREHESGEFCFADLKNCALITATNMSMFWLDTYAPLISNANNSLPQVKGSGVYALQTRADSTGADSIYNFLLNYYGNAALKNDAARTPHELAGWILTGSTHTTAATDSRMEEYSASAPFYPEGESLWSYEAISSQGGFNAGSVSDGTIYYCDNFENGGVFNDVGKTVSDMVTAAFSKETASPLALGYRQYRVSDGATSDHVVTCYGYETSIINGSEYVTKLWICDSDDFNTGGGGTIVCRDVIYGEDGRAYLANADSSRVINSIAYLSFFTAPAGMDEMMDDYYDKSIPISWTGEANEWKAVDLGGRQSQSRLATAADGWRKPCEGAGRTLWAFTTFTNSGEDIVFGDAVNGRAVANKDITLAGNLHAGRVSVEGSGYVWRAPNQTSAALSMDSLELKNGSLKIAEGLVVDPTQEVTVQSGFSLVNQGEIKAHVILEEGASLISGRVMIGGQETGNALANGLYIQSNSTGLEGLTLKEGLFGTPYTLGTTVDFSGLSISRELYDQIRTGCHTDLNNYIASEMFRVDSTNLWFSNEILLDSYCLTDSAEHVAQTTTCMSGGTVTVTGSLLQNLTLGSHKTSCEESAAQLQMTESMSGVLVVEETGLETISGEKTLVNEKSRIEAQNIVVAENSELKNNGTIQAGIDVMGTLSGSGSFGETTAHSGSTVVIGGSPGAATYESLTLKSGSEIVFSVDGATPAAEGVSGWGSGAHSVLTLTGTDALVLEAGAEVKIGFSSDFLTSVSIGIPQSLTLIEGVAANDELLAALQAATVFCYATPDDVLALLTDATLYSVHEFSWTAGAEGGLSLNFTLYYDGKGAENIPEPTTATLSLLALTALAARRRRR